MKFEYKTIEFPVDTFLSASKGEVDIESFNEALNRLGENGWELVNTFDLNDRTGSTRVVAVLKRPK